ncbi:MAG: hypothetical protein GXX83_11185 [Gaiellales bacterium]|nr:hypothetical protein [Gaiellales bacterium]
MTAFIAARREEFGVEPMCAVLLIRALALETHEGWLEEHRYLSMDLLVEHRRELLRQLEDSG